nr:MFS transporter [Amycolatopsis coloradensis]
MAVEHAPPDKKTFYGAFAQAGNPAGALLATGLFSLLSTGGTEWLSTVGWRIPFFASVLLIGVGLIVRLKVEESPVFEESAEETGAPILYAVRTNWKPILLGICVLPVAVGGYYLVTTFATAYATDPAVGVSESLVLNALTIAAFVELAVSFGAAWLGDRFGRVRVVVIGLVGVALLAAPQFLVLSTKNTVLIIAAFVAMRLAMTATYSPIAAILSQMFRPRARYTSISLSYQLAGALFGGLSPLVSTLLFQATGSVWPAIGLLIGMCVLSIACVLAAPQHTDVTDTV